MNFFNCRFISNIINYIFYKNYNYIDMNRELNIKRKKYKSKTKIRCMICFEYLKKKDIIGIIDCNHLFHIKCLQKWGKYNPICPLCKINLPILKKKYL